MSGRPLPRRLPIAILLLMTLGGHHLAMASDHVHAASTSPQGVAVAAPHVHSHHARPDPAGLAAVVDLATGPLSGNVNACSPLAPWLPAGGDSGKALDSGASLSSVLIAGAGAGPPPHERTQVDAPDVRRAFLQVYLN